MWELGKERVTEDDITSLDVHHCYVRATVGVERMPAFSMMVRKPEGGDPTVAARIRADVANYTPSAANLASGEAEGQRKVSAYRQLLADLPKGGESGQPQVSEYRKLLAERHNGSGQEGTREPERERQTSQRNGSAPETEA